MSLLRASLCVITVVLCLLFIVSPATTQAPKPDPRAPYLDPKLPLERRVDDLISRMTLEEKVSQMMNAAPAIPRLGIPQYDWWNEALHGVAFSGVATVFPQAIGLGATFNPQLVNRVANVISDEARAKYHEAQRRITTIVFTVLRSGHQTSISFVTRAGDEDKRLTAKTRT